MSNPYHQPYSNTYGVYYGGFTPAMYPLQPTEPKMIQTNTTNKPKNKDKDEEMVKIIEAIENLRIPEKREEVSRIPRRRLSISWVRNVSKITILLQFSGIPSEPLPSCSRKSCRFIQIWLQQDLAPIAPTECVSFLDCFSVWHCTRIPGMNFLTVRNWLM